MNIPRIAASLALAAIVSAAGAAERPILPVLDADALTLFCEARLAQAGVIAEALRRPGFGNGAEVLAAWDRLRTTIEDVDGPAELLSNVSPDDEVRAAGDKCELALGRFDSALYQDAELYRAINSASAATPDARRLKEKVAERFVDAGVALPPDKRARAKAILDRLDEARIEFGRNIRDNKTQLSFTPAEVKGMPADYLAKAKRDDQGNYLLGFAYPEFVPFMANAEDEAARRRYQTAFLGRGTPRNLELLSEAMRLRKELAGLFGLPSYAEYVIRRRMAGSEKAVKNFLVGVKSVVRDVEKQELAELKAYKAAWLKQPAGSVSLNRWDYSFYQDKLKKERYSVDQEALRKYFPLEASLRWVMAISGTLYGVSFRPAEVPLWDKDVRYFDVLESDTGAFVGGIYIDPFPRPSKYSHAAAFGVRSSSRLAGRTPISVLVANLNREGLNQEELETLVHEFGHVMHGVLSNTEYATLGGTSVERDFVEAPSQMYEEWARRKESLSLLPRYCDPACPAIDDAMLDRLSTARKFGAGTVYSRQHMYASYDMATAGASPGDPEAVWDAMEEDSILGHIPGTQFPGTFEHIISGYAAGYYGYMWSQVLALDMLSVYGNNLMNPRVGRRFRSTILSQGSQKPAKQMVHEFLGRDPSNAAFLAEITGARTTAAPVKSRAP